LITPKATIDAVMPAFLFLAACGVAIGLAFTFLGVETHDEPLALETPQLGENRGTVAVHLGREAEAIAAGPTPS
jgi:putative MFS transporter